MSGDQQASSRPKATLDRAVNDGPEEQPHFIYNPNRGLSLQAQRKRLPIAAVRDELLYLLENNGVVIIVGDTGSGKTTQIPQYLHEAGWTADGRRVVCTQPRRVAASTVATRIAEEMRVPLGTEVGYSVRFDERWSPESTRIKLMTDGMLLRETMLDPLLREYSVIMLDEAHERSLHTDILLGLLKKVRKKRPDLRLIISSATLDAEEFASFFRPARKKRWDVKEGQCDTSNVALMSVEGRQYPVEMCYAVKPVADYLEAMVDTIIDIHREEKAQCLPW